MTSRLVRSTEFEAHLTRYEIASPLCQISVNLPCDEAAIRSGSPGNARTTRGTWVLVATILGSSLAFIDGTVVNIALPAMQHDLGASINQVQWIVESYALFLAALLLIGGSLGDLYSRRNIFMGGVLLFTMASVACGLSSTVTQLIVGRGIQGVGAALLVPNSLALISTSFSPEERGRAIGTGPASAPSPPRSVRWPAVG